MSKEVHILSLLPTLDLINYLKEAFIQEDERLYFDCLEALNKQIIGAIEEFNKEDV